MNWNKKWAELRKIDREEDLQLFSIPAVFYFISRSRNESVNPDIKESEKRGAIMTNLIKYLLVDDFDEKRHFALSKLFYKKVCRLNILNYNSDLKNKTNIDYFLRKNINYILLIVGNKQKKIQLIVNWMNRFKQINRIKFILLF
ncbi:hypothetical protein Mgra_00000324 [Meloidogyne graminicola]|uniref:Uncharacterized protein n=1 Tax=Meloidogyne graminicola TaxID=189291 RepID=A0A8T0A314_9BILA|nr:hypothetical protein Mgra_00000324 [Meloidogyne graminicola]